MREYEEKASAFVERFASDLADAGMQRMGARVFACLLSAEDGTLTSAELAERLRISPAAVSGAIRYLAQVRMVSRRRTPGSRRERYVVHEDTWYSSMINREHFLTRLAATLNSGVTALGKDTEAGRRLRETEEFMLFLQDELEGILARWEQRRAARAASS
nr:MarR family transcriptional regulator [Streptomyces boncukensis]